MLAFRSLRFVVDTAKPLPAPSKASVFAAAAVADAVLVGAACAETIRLAASSRASMGVTRSKYGCMGTVGSGPGERCVGWGSVGRAECFPLRS